MSAIKVNIKSIAQRALDMAQDTIKDAGEMAMKATDEIGDRLENAKDSI